MRTSAALLLTLGLGASLAACGSDPPPVTATAPPPPKPWEAQLLQGPFQGAAGFCQHLAAPTCEEQDDVIVVHPANRQPRTAKDGSTFRLLTVASGDPKTRRAHLLLERNTEVFALPPVTSYDPNDGKRREIVARSMEPDERSGLLQIVFSIETTSGEGPAKRRELRARQALCRTNKDFPVACALFETEHLVTTGDDLKEDPEQTAEVLLFPAEGGRVLLKPHGQSGPEGLKVLSAPGEYKISFP
jgi:hypothetical protein